MARISKFDMAQEVMNHNNITIKKSILGAKFIYTPTNSVLQGFQLEYTSEAGAKILRVLESTHENLAKVVKIAKGLEKATIGNKKLEACLSKDKQFAAFQLFTFIDYTYQPETEVKFFEGRDATLLADFFLD